jgi:hypothetical protein
MNLMGGINDWNSVKIIPKNCSSSSSFIRAFQLKNKIG